jgi:hypothetical protein
LSDAQGLLARCLLGRLEFDYEVQYSPAKPPDRTLDTCAQPTPCLPYTTSTLYHVYKSSLHWSMVILLRCRNTQESFSTLYREPTPIDSILIQFVLYTQQHYFQHTLRLYISLGTETILHSMTLVGPKSHLDLPIFVFG